MIKDQQMNGSSKLVLSRVQLDALTHHSVLSREAKLVLHGHTKWNIQVHGTAQKHTVKNSRAGFFFFFFGFVFPGKECTV